MPTETKQDLLIMLLCMLPFIVSDTGLSVHPCMCPRPGFSLCGDLPGHTKRYNRPGGYLSSGLCHGLCGGHHATSRVDIRGQ